MRQVRGVGRQVRQLRGMGRQVRGVGRQVRGMGRPVRQVRGVGRQVRQVRGVGRQVWPPGMFQMFDQRTARKWKTQEVEDTGSRGLKEELGASVLAGHSKVHLGS